MPARTRKIRHDEETRKKIQAAQIINRFQKCVDGEIELTATQVSCGKALLDKSLPDLKSVDIQAEHDVGDNLGKLLTAVAENGSRLGGS